MALFQLSLAALLLTTASAVDMMVQKNYMICDNRAVKASFSYICSDDDVCTLGQTQEIKGSFLYDGLVDTYGLSDEDYFYMDAKIRLGIGGVTTYSQKLLNMTEVPVCSAFTSNAYNSYGDCPADGRYGYSSSFDFPAPSKVDLMSWATTGYEGDILLDVYVQTSLVGRCVVPIKTMVTGSYEKGFFETKPSGAIAAIIAASLMALLVMYAMCLLIKACQAKRTKRKTLRQEAHADYASSYNRMESGAEDDSTDITPSISMVSNAESRYSLPGGPVI